MRNFREEFSSVRSAVKRFFVRLFQFLVASVAIGAVVFFIVMAIKYKTGNYAERASAQTATTTPKAGLSSDFDAFYEQQVVEYKQRGDFKAEIDAYADTMARNRVLNAVITKVEQKVK